MGQFNQDITVGITMGDPAGIGPEIVIKALLNPEIYDLCKPVVIGDLTVLKNVSMQLRSNVRFKRITTPLQALKKPNLIEVIDLQNVNPITFRLGEVSREAGKAAIEYIQVAVKHALNGAIGALTTAPINKESIHLAGLDQVGHTELLGVLTNTTDPLTMFWLHGVAIFFLTRHIQLKKAIEAVKKDRIVDLTIKMHYFLQQMGISEPRIAVAALNPHTSDNSLMGDEEETEILPAVRAVRAQGINTIGPIAADAVFHQAFLGQYDGVLSLYHDQGHVAAKTFDFDKTVAVTLGLPFIRTSVDHGTAYEIAGKGLANSKSLEEAIRAAVELSLKFNAHTHELD